MYVYILEYLALPALIPTTLLSESNSELAPQTQILFYSVFLNIFQTSTPLFLEAGSHRAQASLKVAMLQG